MIKSLLVATTVAATLGAPMMPAVAFSGMIDTRLPATASAPVEQVQFRGGGGFGGRPRFYPQRQGFRGGGHGYRGGGYGYRGGYGRHRGGFGVGAGLAGLAAGAVIGGAIASQAAPAYGYGYAPAPEPVGDGSDYCAQRYRSYDPGSGTYLGYDGLRHPCP